MSLNTRKQCVIHGRTKINIECDYELVHKSPSDLYTNNQIFIDGRSIYVPIHIRLEFDLTNIFYLRTF